MPLRGGNRMLARRLLEVTIMKEKKMIDFTFLTSLKIRRIFNVWLLEPKTNEFKRKTITYA